MDAGSVEEDGGGGESMVKWHWQNLNKHKDGQKVTHRYGWWHGRCWWYWGLQRHKQVCLEWCIGRLAFGLGFDVDDEDLTIYLGALAGSLYLSLPMNVWPLNHWPKIPLGPNYPDTYVVDSRECAVKIFDWVLSINPWCPRNSWTSNDPWWRKGIRVELNPFRWHHIRHQVLTADGLWQDFVGSWEHEKTPDSRKVEVFPYSYTLRSGEVQERSAAVYVERREWRPKCLRWLPLIRKIKTSIDVEFSDEVGERTGSWKGGTIGCGWELRRNETPEQALRRMEKERVFD